MIDGRHRYRESGPRARGYACKQTIDRRGVRRGMLVIEEITPRRVFGNVVWIARCDCGRTREVDGQGYMRGHFRSCGCVYVPTTKYEPSQYARRSVVNRRTEEPRKPKPIGCQKCCDLSWRVVGIKCSDCGLAFAHEVIERPNPYSGGRFVFPNHDMGSSHG